MIPKRVGIPRERKNITPPPPSAGILWRTTRIPPGIPLPVQESPPDSAGKAPKVQQYLRSLLLTEREPKFLSSPKFGSLWAQTDEKRGFLVPAQTVPFMGEGLSSKGLVLTACPKSPNLGRGRGCNRGSLGPSPDI